MAELSVRKLAKCGGAQPVCEVSQAGNNTLLLQRRSNKYGQFR